MRRRQAYLHGSIVEPVRDDVEHVHPRVLHERTLQERWIETGIGAVSLQRHKAWVNFRVFKSLLEQCTIASLIMGQCNQGIMMLCPGCPSLHLPPHWAVPSTPLPLHCARSSSLPQQLPTRCRRTERSGRGCYPPACSFLETPCPHPPSLRRPWSASWRGRRGPWGSSWRPAGTGTGSAGARLGSG